MKTSSKGLLMERNKSFRSYFNKAYLLTDAKNQAITQYSANVLSFRSASGVGKAEIRQFKGILSITLPLCICGLSALAEYLGNLSHFYYPNNVASTKGITAVSLIFSTLPLIFIATVIYSAFLYYPV